MRPVERLAARQKQPPPQRTVNGTVVSRAGSVVQVDIGGGTIDATSPAAAGVTPGATVRVDIAGGAPVVSGVIAGAAMGSLPVGAITLWAGTVVPDGWLTCNGGSFSGTQYPALKAVLGGTNLPDMRDRAPVGSSGSKALKSTGGNASISLGVNELPPHTHTVSNIGIGNFPSGTGVSGYYPSGADSTTSSTGNGNSFSIQNPYVALAFIIYAGAAS